MTSVTETDGQTNKTPVAIAWSIDARLKLKQLNLSLRPDEYDGGRKRTRLTDEVNCRYEIEKNKR